MVTAALVILRPQVGVSLPLSFKRKRFHLNKEIGRSVEDILIDNVEFTNRTRVGKVCLDDN